MQLTVAIIIVVAIGLLWAWFFRGGVITVRHKAAKNHADIPSITEGIYDLALGDGEAALKHFKHMVNHGAPKPEIYMGIAVLLRLQGDTEKAIQLNEALLMRSVPADVTSAALKEVLRCYRIVGEIHNAEKCLEALGDNPFWPEAALLKAEVLSAAGDYEGALRKYARYTKMSGEDADAAKAHIYLHMADNAKDSAARIKALRNAIKTDPACRAAYVALLEQFFADGNISAGMDICREMIEHDLLRGEEDIARIEEIYYKHDNLEKLFSLLSSRIAKDSDSPVPYLTAAKYYIKKGESEPALTVLRDFVLNHAPKIVVLKTLARLSSDSVLLQAVSNRSSYKCPECGAFFDEYKEICPICGGIHTIDYN